MLYRNEKVQNSHILLDPKMDYLQLRETIKKHLQLYDFRMYVLLNQKKVKITKNNYQEIKSSYALEFLEIKIKNSEETKHQKPKRGSSPPQKKEEQARIEGAGRGEKQSEVVDNDSSDSDFEAFEKQNILKKGVNKVQAEVPNIILFYQSQSKSKQFDDSIPFLAEKPEYDQDFHSNMDSFVNNDQYSLKRLLDLSAVEAQRSILGCQKNMSSFIDENIQATLQKIEEDLQIYFDRFIEKSFDEK